MEPPVFGMAPGGTGNGNINLDDIFGGIYFTSEGRMLDASQQSSLSLLGSGGDTQQQQVVNGMSDSGDATAPSKQLPFGVLVGDTAGGGGISSTLQSHLAKPELDMEEEYGHSGTVGTDGSRKRKMPAEVLTKEQKLERRERNRAHAKRSRVRKKFLLDSLQKSVTALQDENEALKGSIRQHLGSKGDKLVKDCECTGADGMGEGTLVTQNSSQATSILDDPDYSLVKALQSAQQNFVITDASLPDNPIVYASGGFLTLTGYGREHVLGRNCRFLQGPETDPRAVDKIRAAVAKGEDTSVCLLNYRADGTTFWNQFFVAALRDGNGKTVNFVGVQCKVSEEYASIVVQKQQKDL